MARMGIGILLTKSEWSELVLVFYWCPKLDNAQPWRVPQARIYPRIPTHIDTTPPTPPQSRVNET